jgi:hypothetical protein
MTWLQQTSFEDSWWYGAVRLEFCVHNSGCILVALDAMVGLSAIYLVSAVKSTLSVSVEGGASCPEREVLVPSLVVGGMIAVKAVGDERGSSVERSSTDCIIMV